MKLRVLLLLIVASFFLGSCAKFPPAGTAGNLTRLTFNFTTAAPINPSYIYVVAIRVLNPPVGIYNTELSDPSQGPSPVVTTGSKNGIVGGLPTHYIVYTETTPNLYQVYRFFLNENLSGELPDSSDPAPINLILPGQYIGDVLPGSAVDPRPSFPGGLYNNTLGFTIDTSYLSQHATTAIQTIQFNIFAMNVTALGAGSINNRIMDAIGNQSNSGGSTFNNPIQVNIQTSGTYTDQTSSVPEQAGDTYPGGASLPAVDLTSWSLTVTNP